MLTQVLSLRPLRVAAENQSLLIYATTLGDIVALDLATGRLAWVLQPPPSLGTRDKEDSSKDHRPCCTDAASARRTCCYLAGSGTLTTFVVDRQRLWLLAGTNRGGLACFDLRFGVLVRSWTIPSLVAIHQLVLSPVRSTAGHPGQLHQWFRSSTPPYWFWSFAATRFCRPRSASVYLPPLRAATS